MAMITTRMAAAGRRIRQRLASLFGSTGDQHAEPAGEFGSVDTSIIPLFGGRTLKTEGIPVPALERRWGVWAFRIYAVLPFVLAAVLLLIPQILGVPQAPGAPAANTVVSTPTSSPRPALLPLASSVTMGRWTFTLGAVQWNQRQAVLDANPFAPAIPRGQGWAIIPLTVRNASSDMLTPGLFEVVLHAGGKSVSHFDAYGGEYRIPEQFTPVALEPGESLRGNLGFRLPDSAASDDSCTIELRVRSTITSYPQTQSFSCSLAQR